MDHPHLKNLVIVKPGCTEFANEFLNRMSIYALGLETGTRIYNPARFGRGALRIPYALYARYVGRRHRRSSLLAWRAPIYLPPSAALPAGFNMCETLYFFGWVFRNPVGLEKFRTDLLRMFAPAPRIQRKITSILSSLKSPVRIGMHIRQTPYPGFEDGSFLISPEQTRQVVEEYLRERSIEKRDVALCLVSDRPVPVEAFADFEVYQCTDPEVGFYLLAGCNAVVGTNSTSANLPAWFGDVPHIVTTERPVDWEYYRSKTSYFENKYATFTQGLE